MARVRSPKSNREQNIDSLEKEINLVSWAWENLGRGLLVEARIFR